MQLQSSAALQTLLMTDERLTQKHQRTATPAQAARTSGPFGPAAIHDCNPGRRLQLESTRPEAHMNAAALLRRGDRLCLHDNSQDIHLFT